MKIPIYIVVSLALVWFGGAGLAFASCPLQPMPACHCPHSHGESDCHCGNHAPGKAVPACAFNHTPLPSCACSITRGDSSNLNITVNRSVDPAIVPESFTITSDAATVAPDQIFRASPSFNTIITPLRI
jgi:hypothetical protein